MNEDIDNQVIEEEKTKRDLLLERMSGKYPDKNFEDENELFGAVLDDADGYEEELSRSREVDGRMTSMLSDNPQFAGMLLSALNSENPILSLIKEYGDDFRSFLDDPENAEKIAEANKSHIDRLSKEKELETTYEANLEKSVQVADELEGEGVYSSEQIDEAFAKIFDDAQKALMGEVTREMLEEKLKGLSYDTDVKEAATEGEIKGRNAKIEAKKKNLKDELPIIEGKGAAAAKPENKTLKSLDRVAKNRDIWQGMKRY